ncbi:hypothetical protein MAQ5080_03232 [Marinomonas aquimarina]|uniref:DUF2971 domain-containing protein n=1 Tax=Marinomonas aquimarina TaxID=295068 RepID=A0A1A8TR29_9GAMM|nr:DUF2971 domain-containing protein [Marinomonas aquimarina]SBS35647.1 hypothetical protein MAQ5080_03232 [Marinomonas aquimarina]
MNGISLYRFEPADIRRITFLKDNKLWFSDPERFNDPLDFDLPIKDLTDRSGIDEKALRKAAFELVDSIDFEKESHRAYSAKALKFIKEWAKHPKSRTQEQVIAEFKLYFKTFGVQCFMKNLDNTLAWSHYASQHQGFCIEYNFYPMCFARENVKNLAQFPITYSTAIPEICLSELIFSPHQALKKFIATKSIEWSYEQEVRLVNYEQKGCAIEMPRGIKMKRLIAGAKMCPAYKANLREVGEHLGIEVCEMEISHSSPYKNKWLALKNSD